MKEEIELEFPKFRQEQQMTPSEICIACHGCCSYVTVPLAYPRSNHLKDMYRWYLLHRNVEIYIDHDNEWQALFKTTCNKLDARGQCTIYDQRPSVCREYSHESCSRVGKDHKHLFATPADLERYFALPAKRRR